MAAKVASCKRPKLPHCARCAAQSVRGVVQERRSSRADQYKLYTKDGASVSTDTCEVQTPVIIPFMTSH